MTAVFPALPIAVAALVAAQVAGSMMLSRGPSLPGRWLAWIGGAAAPAVAVLAICVVLWMPDRRWDGATRARLLRWTRRAFVAGVALFLLDDHIIGHAGTPPPTRLAIPSPYQDYLTLVLLLAIAFLLLAALVTLPGRIGAARRARRAS